MLVITTIFISKMEGLPPTSDTKMIDYWRILSQLVPFAEVVLLTVMEDNDSYDFPPSLFHQKLEWALGLNREQADINASPASQLMISQMFGLSCCILFFFTINVVFKKFRQRFHI